jgi:hypothetical protein
MKRGLKKSKRELNLSRKNLRKHFLPCTLSILGTAVIFLSYIFLTSNPRLNSDLSYSDTQNSSFNIALAVGYGVNASISLTNTDGVGSSCKLAPTVLTTSGTLITCKATITVNNTPDYGYTASIASSTTETRLVGTGLPMDLT